MKTYFKITALLCFLCLTMTISAQCPQGNVELLSQQDVNNFGTLYPNCTELSGNLQIGAIEPQGNNATNITDLSPFSGITYIGGDLMIGRNDSSMTFNGLSGLDSIGGGLQIYRDNTFEDFTGLENLQSIGNDLTVDVHSILRFTGLNNLTSIGGDFNLEQFDIENFTGLENLNTIGGDFHVRTGLGSFQGLNNLSSIGGGLFIGEDQSFTDFSGLENLTSIGGTFGIAGEDASLVSFMGLENLAIIGKNFDMYEFNGLSGFSDLENLNTIGGNLVLEGIYNDTDTVNFPNLFTIGGGIYIDGCNFNSLAGFGNLTDFGNSSPTPTPFSYVIPGEIRLMNNSTLNDISAVSHLSIDTLTIIGNSNLSICGIESVCNYLEQGGAATIENNAEGCNTIEEVMQSCTVQCPIGDVELLSQDEVNEFGTLYPDCTELSGSLQIGTVNWNEPTTDIIDLSSLNNITAIAGNLMIGRNDSSMTLAGLSNLGVIGNSLIIEHVGTIENLEGLENLTVINGDFLIKEDNDLVSLTGLENLMTIGGTLLLDSDSFISNFQGLNSLSSIGIDLIIGEDTELENFVGLENLNSIGGNLFLDEEADVGNFMGLESLTSIVGDLRTDGDALLDSFSGLESLTHIGGNLHITPDDPVSLSGMENLMTIEGNLYIGVTDITNSDLSSFESLSTIGGGLHIRSLNIESLNGLESVTNFGNFPLVSNIHQLVPGEVRLEQNDELIDISAISQWAIDTLTIAENDSLSVCSIASICEYLAQGSAATIENNATGCNNVEEIFQNCAPLLEYTIQGNIFADTNANCLQDASETGLDDWLIKIEENGQIPRYAYTFGGGNYIALADSGAQYTITAIPPNMLWDNICPADTSITISADNPKSTVAFGAIGSTACPLLEVDITSPIVRRCFDSNYYVRYCNSGTAIAEDAYIEVQLDPFFTYQNSTIDGIHLGDNLYSFDLNNINISECGSFRIDVYVDCDSTLLGQTHCVEAHIYPDSICAPILPLWDGSSIEVDAQCLGDSIEFKIENIGMGDMSDSLEYIVVEEDLIHHRAKFQLNSGDNLKFQKQANGLFHRLESEQAPGHPGNSMPSVFVEGCSEGDNGEISMGFVNYYLLDEGDAFVSIDCQENVGSYDPNDKQAFPIGHGPLHFITDSTDLEYMIRFQNTGTDTAFNVVIRDTISPHLDIETLRPGVASHPYRYDIEGANIAVFHFENIMLPDSNVNEIASHGFIKFTIEQQANNELREVIENSAAIYFDFNEPVITNTVSHTVNADFLSLVTSVVTPPEVIDAGISVNVFPNPFDEFTTFEIEGTTSNELFLSLYDTMGREILQRKTNHQKYITLHKNKLPSGIYIFKLMDEKQQLASGKLMIK